MSSKNDTKNLIPISTTTFTENATLNNQISGAIFGATLACILLTIPLGLIYVFVFHRKNYWFRSILLFFMIYILGSVINLLFYRVVVMNNSAAQIGKMGINDVQFVLSTTLGGFMIVALTLMGLSANPSLVAIFENTIGYGCLRFFGIRELMSEVFSSKTMDPIKEGADPNQFNYSFLITQFNLKNIDELIEYGKACVENKHRASIFGLDFNFALKYQEQADKVRDMVYLKNTIGHYVWIYLTTVVALIVSMVAAIM
jgi:hypothetical protein